MKKKLILIISAIVVIASIVYLIVINTDKENKTTVTDAEKFKTEYEKINGDINEKYNVVTREVDIPKDNPIVYISPENLVEKMDNKETFVVYFGFANCPWCRSVIETMFKVAKDYKINKIYYVDVSSIRDTYKLDEDNKPVVSTEGTSGYYKLLDKFSKVLEDYLLNDEDGNKVPTGEKRIYAPNIVGVINGEAKELETGISELQTDAYMDLTEEMKDDMYNKLKCVMKCVSEENISCSYQYAC